MNMIVGFPRKRPNHQYRRLCYSDSHHIWVDYYRDEIELSLHMKIFNMNAERKEFGPRPRHGYSSVDVL